MKPMKTINKSRILCALIIIMILLQAMAVTAALPDIVIVTATSSVATVTQGTDFTLQITFANKSAQTLGNIMLDFSLSDDVIVKAGGSVVELPSGTLAPDATTVVSIPLRYTGSGGNQRIPVRFIYSYEDESFGETLTNVYISAAASPAPGPMPDTSKFKPVLKASVIGTDSVFAGYTNEITLRVHNINMIYAAKNVMIQAIPPSGSPFEKISIPGYGMITEIKPGEYIDVILQVSTDKFADDQTAALPIKISYSNIWNDEFTADTDVALKITNPADPARIIIADIKRAPDTVQAGGEFDLTIRLANLGTFYADDVKLIFDDLSVNGFMMVSGSNTVSVGRLSGSGAYDAVIRLRAAQDMKTGSMPLSLRIEYEDERKNKTAQSQQIWIPVEGKEDTYTAISFTSVSASTTRIDPAGSFTVKAVIRNDGTKEARQIKIHAGTSSSSLYPATQDTFIVQTLQPGESKTFTFGFSASDDAQKGIMPVVVSMDVQDGNGGVTTLSQTVSVYQNGKPASDDPGKNIPRIIINSYSTDPGVVKAGEQFLLDIEFLNTHVDKTIYNIKVSFNVSESSSETGNVFSPVDSSNTLFIDSIGPKESLTKQLSLYTITDAKAKTYTVTFSFDYQDAAGNPFKSDEIIGIPVYQPSRFEISEPYLPYEIIAGQPLYLFFEMYNLGKNTLYNVKLRVEGIESEPKNAYYGNFEPGRNEYAELSITPMESGTVTASIIVSYENSSGELNETIRELYLNVIDMPIDDGGDWPIPPDGEPFPPDEVDEGGFFDSLLFKILAGVLAAGIITAVIVVIKKRKRLDKKGFEI